MYMDEIEFWNLKVKTMVIFSPFSTKINKIMSMKIIVLRLLVSPFK